MAAEKKFPLAVIIRGVDRVTGVIGNIQRRISAFYGRVSGAFSRMDKRLGLGALSKAAGETRKSLGELSQQIGGIVKQATVGAALVAGAAYGMLKSFADAGEEIANTADRLGVNAEKFQEYRFAADQAGIANDVFVGGLSKLSVGLGKAATGKGNVGKVMAALRINLRDGNGRIKTATDLLPELADRFAKIQDPALRAAAASELFGRGMGPKFAMLLAQGSGELERQAARARELGVVMSEQTARDTEAFGDQLNEVTLAGKGLAYSISAAILPTVAKLTDRLTTLVVRLRPRIQAFAAKFAEQLPGRLQAIADGAANVYSALYPLVRVVGWLVDVFGAGNVVLGLMAVRLAMLLPAIWGAAVAVKALGVAMLATPIGWIIAGIAAVALAAYAIYRNWEPISRWLGSRVFGPFLYALRTTRETFVGMWESITIYWEQALQWMGQLWEQYNPFQLIRRGMDEVIGWVSNWGIGEAIREKVASIASYLPSWLRERLGIDDIPVAPSGAAGAALNPANAAGFNRGGEVRVRVDLNGLPPGTRTSQETRGRPEFELNQGYALGGAM